MIRACVVLLAAVNCLAFGALHEEFYDSKVPNIIIEAGLKSATKDGGDPKEALAALRPAEAPKKFVSQGKIDFVDYKLPGCDFTFGLNYYIPKSYDLKEPAKLAPVLIFLHGGGQSTQSYEKSKAVAQSYMKSFTEYCEKKQVIMLCPSSALGWGMHTAYLPREALNLAKRDLPIDLNRVVISGHSMGAMGISRNYQYFPDISAGYFAQSGMIVDVIQTPELIKTNYNAPFIYINGEKDHFESFNPMMREYAKKLAKVEEEMGQKTKFELIFRPGAHNYDLPQTYEKYDVLFAKQRELYQKDLYATFSMFDYPGDPKAKQPLPAFTGARIDRYFWLKMVDYPAEFPAGKGAYFEAHIKDNNVAIKITKNDIPAKHMRVYLSQKMLDLTKPVTVTVEGKTAFSGMVQTGLDKTVKIARENGDPTFIFDGSVDVELPPPPPPKPVEPPAVKPADPAPAKPAEPAPAKPAETPPAKP